MMAHTDSGDPAGIVTNAPDAKVHILCPSASSRVKRSRPTLEKGRTPVRVEKRVPFLGRYPDRASAQFLLQGFAEGFNIPCTWSTVPPVVDNVCSTNLRPEMVSAKLSKEVSMGRMAGPFSFPPLADFSTWGGPQERTQQITPHSPPVAPPGAGRSMTLLTLSCAWCHMPLLKKPLSG